MAVNINSQVNKEFLKSFLMERLGSGSDVSTDAVRAALTTYNTLASANPDLGAKLTEIEISRIGGSIVGKMTQGQKLLAAVDGTFGTTTAIGSPLDLQRKSDLTFEKQLRAQIDKFDTRTSDDYKFIPLQEEDFVNYEETFSAQDNEFKSKNPTPAQVRRDRGMLVYAESGGEDIAAKYKGVAYCDKLNPDTIPVSPLEQVGLTHENLVRFDEDPNKVENDFPVFSIGAAVWIQGVDVSPYLKSQVSVEKNSVQGHNTLTIVLDNSQDKFVWTERNLAKLYGGRDYYYDDFGRRVQIDRPFNDHEHAKEEVFAIKADPAVNPPVKTARNTVVFPRFDLNPNGCCFARMDPIRFWSLYPFRPQGQNDPDVRELWVPEFTGFISSVTVEDDELTGSSTITIECVDSRQAILQRMRISAEPNLGLGNALDFMGFPPEGVFNRAGERRGGSESTVARQARDQFAAANGRYFNLATTQFYDDVSNSEFGQLFPNKNFEESIKELLVFKPDRIRTGQASRGARDIQYGGTFSFPSSAGRPAVSSYLSDYHAFCLFGPKRRPWTLGEVKEVGEGTRTYSPDDPYRFGEYYPGKCRLWFLLPEEGTGPRSMADLGNPGVSPQHQVNYNTRLEVLRNFVESLDYQMFVSGTGDYHIEFPMADFRPEDFGTFQNSFRFRKITVNTGYSDEAEEPVGAVAVQIGLGVGKGVADSPVAANLLNTVYAFSPYITARYGVIVDNPISIPFLRRSENDIPIAQQRAVIQLQKANARVHSMQMTTAFRPFLLPNRPIHHLRRSRMGTSVTVSNTFAIGLQTKATTTISLEHIRKWTGWYRTEADKELVEQQTKEWSDRGSDPSSGVTAMSASNPDVDHIGSQVYQTIMSGESLAVGARYGWGRKAVLAPDSGVYVLDLRSFVDAPVNFVPPPLEETNPQTVSSPQVSVPNTAPNNTAVFQSPLTVQLRVSSPFGLRTHPVTGEKNSMHAGVDYRAEVGSAVLAVADGVISKIKFRTGGGLIIDFRPDNKDYPLVQYMHLSEADGRTPDDVKSKNNNIVLGNSRRFKAGDIIGKVGITGQSSGPHLHISVYKPGSNNVTDPVPLIKE